MFKFENNFLETFCWGWGMLLNFHKIPIQLMCDDAHEITFQYCATKCFGSCSEKWSKAELVSYLAKWFVISPAGQI